MPKTIRVLVAAFVVAAILAPASPGRAHGEDLITANGRAGPIRNGYTTTREMKDMFGEPIERDVVRVGCSRVVRLRWTGIQVFAYPPWDYRIVDVKVRDRRVRAKAVQATLRFHTRKGLRVGDRESRLQELYPNKEGVMHRGHTHYTIAEGTSGAKIFAKVVDNRVVELESGPSEYC